MYYLALDRLGTGLSQLGQDFVYKEPRTGKGRAVLAWTGLSRLGQSQFFLSKLGRHPVQVGRPVLECPPLVLVIIVKLLYYKIGFRKHKSILRIEHLEVGNQD